MTSTDVPAEHRMHGAVFHSYVAPSRGSHELCAWKVSVDPGVRGQGHEITREEVFLALTGAPSLTVDDRTTTLAPGDVVLAPAGSTVRLDNDGQEAADLWVTTSVGLTARLADGQEIAPPWTR
jgi:quercetin dioxygenase-like cupin family protein